MVWVKIHIKMVYSFKFFNCVRDFFTSSETLPGPSGSSRVRFFSIRFFKSFNSACCFSASFFSFLISFSTFFISSFLLPSDFNLDVIVLAFVQYGRSQ